jgi:hypothetical protein
MERLFPEIEPEPTPTPVPTEAPWSGQLIDREESAVASITVTRPGEGEWILVPVIGEFQMRNHEVVGRAGLRFNQAAMRSLSSRAFNMTVERLDHYEGTLGDFGFGPEQTTVQLQFRDGTSETIQVGNPTPDGRRQYIKLESGDEIFTAQQNMVNSLLITENRIRDLSLVPPDSREAGNVERYAVLGGDRRNVDVVRVAKEELETAERAFPSELRIVAPVTADVSVERFTELILEDLEEGVWAESVVEDHPADLSVYGLDEANAAVFILEMRHRPMIELRIGATREGFTYVMFGDEPSVLRVEEARLTFLRRPYNEFVSPFIWLYNIRDIQQVAYSFGGRRHVLEFNRVPDVDHWEYEGGLDGIAMTDQSISQLFMRSIDIRIGQELPAGFRPGRPDMTVELTFLNGSTRRMTYHYLNDRQVAIGVDGVYQFFAHIPDIDRLQAGIDLALAGQPLPRY